MTILERLPKELERKRDLMGLNDAKFARFMGVTKATWSLTKTGQTLIGDKLSIAIALHFPDLGSTLLEYQAERARHNLKIDRRNRKAA